MLYVRISDDPEGSEKGVDRQETDCRAYAKAHGMTVVDVFRENDTSAFKQRILTLPTGEKVRRVVRPRFRAMLRFLTERQADVMVAYDLDRAVRDPRDLEDLIDAKVLYGFRVLSTTGSLRLDNDSDIAMARVLVAMANKSSADTARRVARAAKQQALEGQTWTVQQIGDDGTVWAVETGNGRKRQHTVALPAEYVEQHAHLSYASTAYGVQGATMVGSHTMLTDALDAAAVYVGMTRGRAYNVLHIVAADLENARQQFIEAMRRDRADRGLDDATRAAKDATRGLIEDGPVKLVNTELARLNREAEQAQRRAERWAQIARQLDAQTAEHKDEAGNADTVLRAVEEHAATVRAQVVEPLTVQAQADGGDYLAAVADEAEATERLHSTGRFGRRRAEHDHHTAREHTEALRDRVRAEWGTVPANADALSQWAAQAANEQAEHTPQVTEATEAVTDAHDARQVVTERQQRDRSALLAKLYGRENMRRDPVRYQLTNPSREARRWQTAADKARAEAERLRALPPAEAARQITARQTAAQAARQATTPEPPQRRPEQPTEPGRGLGL